MRNQQAKNRRRGMKDRLAKNPDYTQNPRRRVNERYRLVSTLMMDNRTYGLAAEDKDSRMDAGDNIRRWD